MKKEFMEAISGRRAIYPKQFNDKEIKPEEIRELLESVRYAPTHRLTEPWRIRVFMNDHKTELAEALKESIDKAAGKPGNGERTKEKFDQSQAILVVSYEKDAQKRVPEWEELAATSMAVQNLWIYTHALGMGGYLSTGKTAVETVTKFVEADEGEVVVGLFYLGRHDHTPRKRPAKSVDEFTKWYI